MTSAEPSAWLDGLPYRLWRANQAVHQRVIGAIDELGVNVTQLGICVHLDELGHMSASDLARLLRLTPQSTTAALNNLEKRGWVVRVPHPVHKRVIWYELTADGSAGAERGRQLVAQVNARIAEVLGEPEQRRLAEALHTLTAEFGGVEVRPGPMWPVPGGGRTGE